jgi:hypothetical protein
MTPEVSLAVLVAVFAAGLNGDRAWSDRESWARLPGAELRGVGAEPATVKARWNEQAIFFEFTCRDRKLVSPGQEDGLDHFRLGDVVEIFLARRGSENYAEVHATPAGKKTCYFFRGYRQPVDRSAEHIAVRAEAIREGWRALIEVPWAVVDGRGARNQWEFLAGRYDYVIAGGKPVLSSFPRQAGRLDFHDRKRFARLELQK